MFSTGEVVFLIMKFIVYVQSAKDLVYTFFVLPYSCTARIRATA